MSKILLITHPDLLPHLRTNSQRTSAAVTARNLSQGINGGAATEEVPRLANKCERDVYRALIRNKHQVETLGFWDDLAPLYDKILEFKPDVVFNLIEEFDGQSFFDQNVVSLLELMKVPYSGCNPRGLILGRDKSLTKKILSYHELPTPKFVTLPRGKTKVKLAGMKYPMIAKCLLEEASTGLAKASIVQNAEKLEERLDFLSQKFQADVIVEEFIEGREFFVSVIGSEKIRVLPPRELKFHRSSQPEKQFFSRRAKFDKLYQQRHGIRTEPAQLEKAALDNLVKLSKLSYRALYQTGYARLDFRMDSKGQFFLIEANPNPDISQDEEFAQSALDAGISYTQLIEELVTTAIQKKAQYPLVA